jgi:tetratricopeptide (TPR) repeat protein/4-amino-4-deoxy-L-arabinose transferase-like glycosyltransferase
LDPDKPKFRIELFALLLGVFALKLIVLIQLHDNPLIQPDAGLDTTAYVTLANKVLAGDWALGPGLYYVSPFYIYFLALCLAMFKSYTALRVAQILLGTASVGFVFEMGRLWFNDRTAWIAAVLMAFTGLFTLYEILILQSSVDAFLASAALYALTRGLLPTAGQLVSRSKPGTPSLVWCLISGLVFGFQTLNRPNVLIAAVGIAMVALVLRRVRLASVLIAGLVLGMAPVAIRNVFVSNEWTFVSSHGGLNFYIGNSEKATGFYQLVTGVSPTIAGQQKDVVRVASRALGRPASEAEASDYFFSLGRSWITGHPGAALALFGKKLLYVFNSAHLPLPHSYPFYAHDLHTALRFYIIGPWLVAPLGLAGLILCAPASKRQEYLIWASFVPLYAVSVAVFFVAERYRLPAFVPLCVTAGAAIDVIVGRGVRLVSSASQPPRPSLESPARAAVVLFTSAALAVPINWPLHTDDGRWIEGLRLTQQLAIHHQFGEAEAWVRRLDANRPPDQASARYGMGAQLLALNLPDRALPYLEAAHRAHPQNATFEYGYGQALFKVGRTVEALPHLKRGFEGGVELPAGGYDYADALRTAGDFAGAAQAVSRITVAENADVEAWLRLGRLAMEVRAPETAEHFFRQAVEMKPDDAGARLQHGLNLLILERYDAAAHELSEAVRLDPKDPDSLAHLAYCEAKLGNAADARTHAQAALAIDPSNELARQILTLLHASPDPR